MARVARVIIPGSVYHVTHRGNRGEDIFLTRADRRAYLKWLGEYSRRYEMDVWAYSLMTNHVHLLVLGHKQESLDRAIGRAHMRYARYINYRNGWTGHLWANRFYSAPLDEAHLWAAVKYVELNPLRAGLVEKAVAYPWSSARAHCGRKADESAEGLLSEKRPFPGGIDDWGGWLAEGLDEEIEARIRNCTYTGRPCGDDSFVDRIESLLARSLRRGKPGRKPKEKGNK